MNDNKQQFEQQLRQTMSNHVVPPPPAMWEEIANDHRLKTPSIAKQTAWWCAAGAVAASVVVAVLLTTMPALQEVSDSRIAEQVECEVAPDNQEVVVINPTNVVPTNTLPIYTSKSVEKSEVKNHLYAETDALQSEVEEYQLFVDSEAPELITGENVPEKTNPQVESLPVIAEEIPLYMPRKRFQPRVSTSLFAENLPAGSTSGSNQGGEHSPMLLSVAEFDGSRTNALVSIVHPEIEKMRHSIPVTFGLGATYEFADRWAAELGINYTYLYSDAKAKASFDYMVKQHVHYLGIPVSVSYDWLRRSQYSLYARLGGAVEYAVSATRETIISDEAGEGSTLLSQIPTEGVQASLLASVGGIYRFNRTMGLYAEAGANYYFENKRQPETYRTANPVSLALRLGLRFHIN